MPLDQELQRWFEKLKVQCETATPQQFENRLEVTVMIYAFVERAFEARFPQEFAAWEAKQEEKADKA